MTFDLGSSPPMLASRCICVVFDWRVVDFGSLSMSGVLILGCLRTGSFFKLVLSLLSLHC